MKFSLINSNNDLSEVIKVLNVSHGTVATKFGFTKESNPSNNAFIDTETLRSQLNAGIDLYSLSINNKMVGCIAIEKSKTKANTFYIEKVSVIPEFRKSGYGIKLMDFAATKIKSAGGESVSIALIDSYPELKCWYKAQGFIETGFKDFEHLPFRVCFMNKVL